MKKKGALGIQELIYFVLGLLVLLLGYLAFNHSGGLLEGIAGAGDVDLGLLIFFLIKR